MLTQNKNSAEGMAGVGFISFAGVALLWQRFMKITGLGVAFVGKIAIDLDRELMRLLVRRLRSDLELIKVIYPAMQKMERDILSAMNWLEDTEREAFYAEGVEDEN